MKTVRVYTDSNSFFLGNRFVNKTFYGHEVPEFSNEDERAIMLDEPVEYFNFVLFFDRKTGSTTGQNFLVDPVELAAL